MNAILSYRSLGRRYAAEAARQRLLADNTSDLELSLAARDLSNLYAFKALGAWSMMQHHISRAAIDARLHI